VVAGGANNQLAEPKHERDLHERGILYLPDFVLNMGGVLGAAAAGMSGDADTSSPEALAACERVVEVLDAAFARAQETSSSVTNAAEELAREAIAEQKR
ncbi:MAG: amino acid dehydrogenase, partial [Myxococcota bacterium]